MAESKVNRNNYVTVQGWMVSDLRLKGNELLIFAIIYGFSQDGVNRFTGSLQYLADWTNSSKQGVSNCLKSLCEKGLLIKHEKTINRVKLCEYQANIDGVSNFVAYPPTNFNGASNKVAYPIQQSCTPPIQQSCTNNIDLDNKKDNIDDNEERKKETGGVEPSPEFDETEKGIKKEPNARKASCSNNKRSYEAIIMDYTTDDELIQALWDFIAMRKMKKNPPTDRALRILLKKLDDLGKTNAEKIKLLETAIERGWLTVYPIKDEGGNKRGGNERNNGENSDYTGKYGHIGTWL